MRGTDEPTTTLLDQAEAILARTTAADRVAATAVEAPDPQATTAMQATGKTAELKSK